MSEGNGIIGQVLQKTYRVTRRIGQGGMGAVFEAVHVRLPRKRYAIKVLLPAMAKRAFTRFRREAEVTSQIGHPHIVDVHDFNETPDGQPYMVMEYLEGEDMRERLLRAGRLAPGEVALLVRQVGGALQAAHDHDVVHRDLKPANIFLLNVEPSSIHAKVLDFGISKITRAPPETGNDVLLGTAHYMSPEQANGFSEEIDHTTDTFALGTICYQALSGELPFDAPTIPGVIYRIRYEEQRPLAGRVPHVHAAVDQVLSRALAKSSPDRFARISDFAAELADLLENRSEVRTQLPPVQPAPAATEGRGGTLVLEGAERPAEPIREPAKVGQTEALARDLGRSRRRVVLAAALVAGVGAGVAVLAVSRSQAPENERSPRRDQALPLLSVPPAGPASQPRTWPPAAAPDASISKARSRGTARPRPRPPIPAKKAGPAMPRRPDARSPAGFEKLHKPRSDGRGKGFGEL